MPGKYAEPDGKVLLAWDNDKIAGGVALRPLDEVGVCEMKRLFVREPWRGQSVGFRLTEQIIEVARGLGYIRMRLDTEKRLEAAINLYRKFGFLQIDQYYNIARDNGAVGGKILGAGGGGFLLFFAEPEHHEHIIGALSDLVHVPFKFDSLGTKVSLYDPVQGGD